MGIKIDYLLVLKIINDNKREISLDLLYQKIVDLNDKRFEMWTRESFYSVIRRLEDEKYVSTKLMKKIPTAKMIKITKDAQDILKIFKNNKTAEVKEMKENQNMEKAKNPVEITSSYPKYKGLEEDELSEIAQEVGYKIIYCMNKEFEELTEKESQRVRKSAPEIVEYIIKQIDIMK